MPGPGLVERVAWLVEGQAVAGGDGGGERQEENTWTSYCADMWTSLLLDVGPQASDLIALRSHQCHRTAILIQRVVDYLAVPPLGRCSVNGDRHEVDLCWAHWALENVSQRKA